MYSMTIRLQTDGDKCLYEQIYEHIRQEIRGGKLLEGERLPSTRSLAQYLQVARSTVDYAYAQLVSEGYIEARPYKGYFVCPLEELLILEEENWGQDRRAEGQSRPQPGKWPAAATGKEGMAVSREAGTGEVSGGRRLGTSGMLDAGKGRQAGIFGLAGAENGRQPGMLWTADAETGIQQAGSVLQQPGKETGQVYDCVVDFSPTGIEMSAFPFSIWKKITKNILNDGNADLFSLGSPQGDWDLRNTISRYLHSSRGVNCDPEQIIIGAGNDYLLMLLEKILGRHVRIAMENPTYKRAYQIFQSFAYQIETVDVDESGMEVSQLKKKNVTAVYVMPSHQYPTGVVMPIGRRAELLHWADQGEERYLIEDDYDSEFRYKGKPIPSLQSSDTHDKVIYIGTFSKAIAPAIRVSYMVLPRPLLEKYQKDCAFYSSTVSRIDQRILNEFIRDGYFERHLNKMRKIYGDKHEILLEGLHAFKKDFKISGENAGLHVLLTARKGQDEEELIRKAAEKGIRVYGMAHFRIREESQLSKEYPATIILGYGGLKEAQIREGIARLKDAWL